MDRSINGQDGAANSHEGRPHIPGEPPKDASQRLVPRFALHLTMRLSDAGLHQRQTKALYPNHRLPPWLTEDAAPRSLEPIVRASLAAALLIDAKQTIG